MTDTGYTCKHCAAVISLGCDCYCVGADEARSAQPTDAQRREAFRAAVLARNPNRSWSRAALQGCALPPAAPLPNTSAPQQYVTPEMMAQRETAAQRSADSRARMAENRRNRLAAQHGCSALSDPVTRTQPMDGYRVKWNRLCRLTAAQRAVVAFARNSAKREKIGYSELSSLADPVAVEHQTPTTSKTWRGLVAAPEVRVNVRGAYGKRGIRGAAARVTQRDNRTPIELLKPLPHVVVGVATHPAATADDYADLLLAIRRDPTLATVRVMTPENPAGTVVAVADYQAQRAAKRTEREATQADRDKRLQEMMGLADPTAATQ